MSDEANCGSNSCDRQECDPRPWFRVRIERVQRITYEREIRAVDEADALAIVKAGTAWPSSYDDRYGDVLEKHEPVVERIENPFKSIAVCYNSDEWKAQSAEFARARNADDAEDEA